MERRIVVCAALLLAAGIGGRAGPGTAMGMGMAAPGVPAQPAAVQTMAPANRMPFYFVENRGQTDDEVAYYASASGGAIYFAPGGVTFVLTPPAQEPLKDPRKPESLPALPAAGAAPADRPEVPGRWAVRVEFAGANPNVRPVGEGRTDAIVSYFTGAAGGVADRAGDL